MAARERATEHQHHRRALARWRTRCPRGRTATANPLAPMATPAPAAGDSPARDGGRRHHQRTTAPGTRRPDSPPPPPTSPHDQRNTQHQHQPHRRPIRTRTPGHVIWPAVPQRRHNVTATSRRRTVTAAPRRPPELPRAWPPCTRNVTGRPDPDGKHTRQAIQAPTPGAPRRADARRPSAPTT